MEGLVSMSRSKTNGLKKLLFTHPNVSIQCVFVLGYRCISPLLFNVVVYLVLEMHHYYAMSLNVHPLVSCDSSLDLLSEMVLNSVYIISFSLVVNFSSYHSC